MLHKFMQILQNILFLHGRQLIRDISSGHGGTSNLNSPTLMVVKKNKTVLRIFKGPANKS